MRIRLAVAAAGTCLLLASCSGDEGPKGATGVGCTATDNGDGTFTVDCGGETVNLIQGADGQPGVPGAPGASCAATDNGDGTYDIVCDGNTVTLSDGNDCAVVDNLDGTYDITCGTSTVTINVGPAASGNDGCLASGCHGNPDLVKTIVVDTATGATETVPLYVNGELFAATTHGAEQCVSCHTDINAGGMHAPVNKTYGGWARFSKGQAVEKIAAGEELKTRNYYSTAVSKSCASCHQNHSEFENSAHATIFKMRGAHIDEELTTFATTLEGTTTVIGENYAVGNCNRCHASCETCHFKATISRKNAHSITEYWDQVQTDDTIDGAGTRPADSMSEFMMDRTANIASHEFRTKEYFATDEEGVCEACHTGYNRPARNAYYWKDGAATAVKAANVRRHPQATELMNSGSDSFSLLTGGTNDLHAQMSCADCHGTASATLGANGNIHNLPGEEYDWRTDGDVQCTDCHTGTLHASVPVQMHYNGAFATKVACIGCHTFGLGRDFELASSGASDTQDVFLDPVTDEVRPVVRKNGHAIAWYSHNWQKPLVADKTDPNGSCAQKCHFAGNVVGAGY